jgi:hypothetical protein
MKDEKYVFIQDVKDKKFVARGAYNKRTHAGGSGKKKWASEYMTKKELAKMNGELKTYRLNDPMTWKEFKALPDDIKKMYIKGIQERFNPFDSSIAKTLFGVHPSTLLDVLKRHGMLHGNVDQRRQWDKEGFEAWARGEKPTEAYQSLPKPTEEEVTEVTEVTEEPKVEEPIIERPKAMPMSGHLRFEGKADDILKAVAAILGGANVNLTINWDIKDGAEV